MIGSFQNFWEQLSFERHCSWFKAFYYLHIRDAGGGPMKAEYLHITVVIGAHLKAEYSFTLQLLLRTPLKAEYLLHITVAVGGGPWWKQSTYTLHLLLGPFETKVFTHYSCCWGPLWKQSTYALHLLLGPFESKVFTHRICYCGPLWKRSTSHYSCCCEPLQKQSTKTLQCVVGGPFESRVPAHCRRCRGHFWKQRTCTFQLLLGQGRN